VLGLLVHIMYMNIEEVQPNFDMFERYIGNEVDNLH
jgi:hypothetical protein